MDEERRSEVRVARRQRRKLRTAATTKKDGSKSGAEAAAAAAQAVATNTATTTAMTPQAAATTTAADDARRRRRRRLLADGALQLSRKMQRRRDAQREVDAAQRRREATIQSLYAPHVAALLARSAGATATSGRHDNRNDDDGGVGDNASASVAQQDGRTAAVAASPSSRSPSATAVALARDAVSMRAFDVDRVVTALLRDSHGRFAQLDRTLATDAALSLRRLHGAVFAHTNDFVLLFRDVARAGERVEELKTCVQSIKATIAHISRVSYANVVSLASAATSHAHTASSSPYVTTTAAGVFAGAAGFVCDGHSNNDDGGGDGSYVSGYLTMGGVRRLSLVSRRHVYVRATRRSRLALRARRQANVAAAAAATDAATTHDVHVESLLLWRHALCDSGVGDDDDDRGDSGNNKASRHDDVAAAGAGAAVRRGVRGGSGAAPPRSATAAVTPTREALHRFVDAVREELDERMAEQRHDEAAQLLHSIAGDAAAQGCLPLLLDMEAAVVYAVVEQLHGLPVALLYLESLHVPLLQLLLRFGRVRTATSTYWALQAEWLRGELHALQSRVSPAHASRVTVDFLVCAMRAMVRRQRTLALTLDEVEQLGDGAVDVSSSKNNNNSNDDDSDLAKKKKVELTSRLLPANAATLLWVRAQTLRFAREVLATHVLSYGVGTDGGDVSRLRRAARLISEAAEALRTMARDGFAGCDALVLRQLTPSLLQLEAAHVRWQVGRLARAQRVMGELLHSNVLRSLAVRADDGGDNNNDNERSGAAVYVPSACADVARKSNARCQALLRVVQCLPDTPHTWLLQLLLAPASARRRGSHGADGATRTHAAVHRFFRYANGCSVVLVQLVESLFGFLAAMCGSDVLPVQMQQRQQQQERQHEVARGSGDHVGESSDGAPRVRTRALQAHVRVAALLLGSALVTDSVDVTLHALLDSHLRNGAAQRDALLRLLASRDYARAQRAAASLPRPAPAAAEDGACAMLPWCSGACATRSPAWVLDAVLAQLADVLATCVLTAYVGSGGALADVYTDAALHFRPQHVRRLQRTTAPREVRRWLVCAVALAHHARRAAQRALGVSRHKSDATDATTTTKTTRGATGNDEAAGQQQQQQQRQQPQQAAPPPVMQGKGNSDGARRAHVTKTTATSKSHRRHRAAAADDDDDGEGNRQAARAFLALAEAAVNASVGGVEGASGARGMTGALLSQTPPRASATNATRPSKGSGNGSRASADKHGRAAALSSSSLRRRRRRRCASRHGRSEGLLSVPVVDYTARGNNAAAPLYTDKAAMPSPAAPHNNDNNDDDEVRERKLMLPLLVALLERPFRTPRGYTAHLYAGDGAAMTRASDAATPPTTASTATTAATTTAGAAAGSFVLRRVLRSYPAFPLGRAALDRHDELFLFHWFAQMTLHLFAFLQERLLLPSYVVNARAADARAATAQRDAWPLRGGVSPGDDDALAVLCAGGGNYVAAVAVMQFVVLHLLRDALCQRATWAAVYESGGSNNDDAGAVQRQQLFFFALYMRFWSPLFARDAAGLSPSSSLALLQSLSCGDVDGAGEAAATMFAAPGAFREGHSGATTAATTAGATKNMAAAKAESKTDGGADDDYAPPQVLLRVVRAFVEREVGARGGMHMLQSTLMRNRVERALADINLRDYVGTTFGASDDDVSSDDDEDATTATTQLPDTIPRVTLHDMRAYIATLVRPLT